jgi:hypothetical protein
VALNDPYSWVKFVHVIGVLAFLAAHGASVNVAFKLRGERDRERMRALLDLSLASLNVMYASLGVLFLAGVLAGIMGGWFTRSLWMWVSLVLLVAILVAMYYRGTSYFNELRKAAGLPYAIGSRRQPAVEPVAEEDLLHLVAKGRPWELTAIGFGGIAVIAFLMMFKPF